MRETWGNERWEIAVLNLRLFGQGREHERDHCPGDYLGFPVYPGMARRQANRLAAWRRNIVFVQTALRDARTTPPPPRRQPRFVLNLSDNVPNLYKRPANAGERLRGEEPVTQFGRMCAKLGITLIAANSPQAKGRVERQHGTHQDRLVKKLRRRGIHSHEAANVYLEREYLPEHNQRFGRCAARPEDYHRKAPCAAELDRIFRLESERTVSDDWVVRYDNRFFQLEPQSGHIVPARSKVWVCEGRYGRMSIESEGRALRWREIAAPVQPQGPETAARKATARVPISVKKRKWTPPPSHPWHEPPRPKVQKRASKWATTAPRSSLAWPCTSP